jgi:tetratricopeptide (TPR) repeat protein
MNLRNIHGILIGGSISLAMSIPAFGDVAGTQCWINGKLTGGFPPGYVCPGTGGQGPAVSPSEPAYDYQAEELRRQEEAEQQRIQDEIQQQKEIEAQKKFEADEKLKHEEFQRAKEEALRSMKGISEGEFGLKNLGNGDDLGLKQTGKSADEFGSLKDGPKDTPQKQQVPCQWGGQGSHVVDLRCMGLDPDKPIVIDPHVVRGQQRVFPAQIDPATFENANYNSGFQALMRPGFKVEDAMDAIAFFKAARQERPDDPMVRNGLLLAQDILKGRQKKEQKDKAQAQQLLIQGVATMLTGDVKTANDLINNALKLDPNSAPIGAWSRLMYGLENHYQEGNRLACKLVGNALYFEALGAFKAEIRTLEIAAQMFPNDTYVKGALWRAQHLDIKNPDHSSVAPGAVTTYPPKETLKP